MLLGWMDTYSFIECRANSPTYRFGICFVLSMGPIPCIITAELLPTASRSCGMSIAVAVQWGANAVVTQCFPSLMAIFGTQGVLLCFAGATMCAWTWIFFCVPETKGQQLEESARLAR